MTYHDHLPRRALGRRDALFLSLRFAKLKPDSAWQGVIEVVVEIDDGNLVYDLKVLSAEGRLQEIEVDAATGKILKMEDDDSCGTSSLMTSRGSARRHFQRR